MPRLSEPHTGYEGREGREAGRPTQTGDPDPSAASRDALSADKAGGNRLLAALPPDEFGRLLPLLEEIEAARNYVFYQPNEPISHVYFPLSGVASLLTLDEDSDGVEVGTVGNEGMVGIPVFLTQDATPGKGMMQVPGAVLRMPVADFRREVVDVPGSRLQVFLQRYTHALMVQMAQGVGCNRLHTIEQRAARWLLTTRDRAGGATFPLTQEFLAQMLGVRRAGVSEVASALQQDGLLTYTRGVITILDAAGLEARACVCYRIIHDVFVHMLDGL